jgi:hypothetical protein
MLYHGIVSITIQLAPSATAALRQKALEVDLSIEEYAQRLIEDAVANSPTLNKVEAYAVLESFRGKLKDVSDDAVNRNLLYEDR